MPYKTFEIKDGNLHLNNENSAPAEPSDIDVFLDCDYDIDNIQYGCDLVDIGDDLSW